MANRWLIAVAAGVALSGCARQRPGEGPVDLAGQAHGAASEKAGAPGRSGSGAAVASRAVRREIFSTRAPYHVKGRVSAVDPARSELVIAREGLPPAELRIAPETRIEIGGRPARLHDLRPGADVRASFDVDRQLLIATHVAADAPPAKARGAEPSGVERHR